MTMQGVLGLMSARRLDSGSGQDDERDIPPWSQISPTVALALHDLVDEWDRRLQQEPRPEARLSISHLLVERSTVYDLNDFELEVEATLDVLVAICSRPLDDLRSDDLVQPVGRARRPARAVARQLVAHSEQWARWRPNGPEPREILASIR